MRKFLCNLQKKRKLSSINTDRAGYIKKLLYDTYLLLSIGGRISVRLFVFQKSVKQQNKGDRTKYISTFFRTNQPVS